MLTIALTGGIACGKSTVAAMLAELGAPVIDADAISRALTAPGGAALPAIREAFGPEVFGESGALDRAALGRRVFADPAALQTLNALTHPLICREMERGRESCRKSGAPVVVLDVPLLFEAGMQDLADVIVCVRVSEAVQLARVQSRDGLSEAEALGRIRSQMPLAQKACLSDVVIENERPLSDVRAEVEALYTGWLDAARKEKP